MKGQLLLIILIVSTCVYAQFGGGSGTEADPWLIETAEDLDNIRNYLGAEHTDKHFQQTTDIDLGVAPWNVGTGWQPIGTLDDPFQGNYDGNNHLIDGLYINQPDTDYIGLFAYVSGAEISNLGLTNVNVTGQSHVGAMIANCAEGSFISGCFSSGIITGIEENVGGLIGKNLDSSVTASYNMVSIESSGFNIAGLIGNNANSIISDCYNWGEIRGGGSVGGLIGANQSSELIGCYNKGTISGTGNIAGGLVGNNSYSPILDSYSTGNVSGAGSVGGLIGSNFYSTIQYSYANGDVSGTYYDVGGLVGSNRNANILNCYATGSVYGSYGKVGGLIGESINSNISNSYSIGAISGDNYHLGGLIGRRVNSPVSDCFWNIETANIEISDGGADLTTAQMLQQGSFLNWDFNNGWDIIENISYPYLQWQTIESYPIPGVGSFEGVPGVEQITLSWTEPLNEPLGYNVYRNGLLLNDFGLITNTEYTDNNIPNWQLNDYFVTAVFVLFEEQTVESLKSITLNLSAVHFAGGDGSRENPYQINSQEFLYGIRYVHDKSFVQTTNIFLSASGWDDEGWEPIGNSRENPFSGVFNGNNFIIDGLFINRLEEMRQGLFGFTLNAEIMNVSLTNVDLTAFGDAGGLVGENQNSVIDNCSVTGVLTATGYFVGGLVGVNNRFSIIRNSNSSVIVNGDWDAGGLAGGNYNNSIIENSFSSGTVSARVSVGGLAGMNDRSLIQNCHSSSVVSGDTSAGGLIGNNFSSTVRQSYSTGNVAGTFYYAGGLVARNEDSFIYDSYSLSNVTGFNYAGGLVGFNERQTNTAVIERCYSIGTVSGSTFVGGLVGGNRNSLVLNSYWDTETSGISISAAGTGRTTQQMTYPHGNLTFVNWNFDTIWVEDENYQNNAGYPYLSMSDLDLFAAGDGTRNNPYQIATPQHLDNIRQRIGTIYGDKHFVQTADIDFSGTDFSQGNGWKPLGRNFVQTFSGNYDGNGYYIKGLRINRFEDNQGLFGYTFNAVINNVGLVDTYVGGGLNSGALVGNNRNSKVDNCFVTGQVIGGSVIGGLIGNNWDSELTNSYSLASVSGAYAIGGLIGVNRNSVVRNCFSKGNVAGSGNIGGLIGRITESSNITFCYSTGYVQTQGNSGGLAAYMDQDSNLSYSYWNTETSGQNGSEGGEGRTTAEMTYPYSANTYIDWDFEMVWSADSDYLYNNGYPYLSGMTTEVKEETIAPISSKMIVYPNPFNPVSNISFTLVQKENIHLAVYNIKGELVKTLLNEELKSGEHTIQWNGINNQNRPVSSGVYFYHLQAADRRETKKAILLK